MASPQQDQATATVLQALQALYHDPDSGAKKRANEWLEEFQHSVSQVTSLASTPTGRLGCRKVESCRFSPSNACRKVAHAAVRAATRKVLTVAD